MPNVNLNIKEVHYSFKKSLQIKYLKGRPPILVQNRDLDKLLKVASTAAMSDVRHY